MPTAPASTAPRTSAPCWEPPSHRWESWSAATPQQPPTMRISSPGRASHHSGTGRPSLQTRDHQPRSSSRTRIGPLRRSELLTSDAQTAPPAQREFAEGELERTRSVLADEAFGFDGGRRQSDPARGGLLDEARVAARPAFVVGHAPPRHVTRGADHGGLKGCGSTGPSWHGGHVRDGLPYQRGYLLNC